MNPDPNFYRVIAVAKPTFVNDIAVVVLTLQNMKGEEKYQTMAFPDIFASWEFYRTQEKIIKGKQK